MTVGKKLSMYLRALREGKGGGGPKVGVEWGEGMETEREEGEPGNFIFF